MKRIFAFFAALLMPVGFFAQAPESMSYQAVIRNSNGDLVVNSSVGMRISIQKYVIGVPPSYQNVYVETHVTATNENGLVSIKVGQGTVVVGVFANINWSDGTYFIKTETDVAGGSNYTISGTSQLLSVPYALYAKSTKTYKIGEFAHGGIVFWVDETGQHGLVCAKTDQSTGASWYAGTIGNTRAYGDGPLAGKANTFIIIAAQVAIGDDGSTYAARICNELHVTEGGKTYGDWYLPSAVELYFMYLNRVAINVTATANGGTSFESAAYWSSNETNNINARYHHLGTGVPGSWYKYGNYRVRAVRSF